MTLDGLVLVDKEPGCTSHDVVQRARRLLGQRKIGHCGTLDPDATGLLVLTLGKATRLTRFLINAPKLYGGTMRFGVTTDTYDASGSVTATASTENLSKGDVVRAMKVFEGSAQQAAPPFSAKKIGGVKYYELARRGEDVPKTSKSITIFEFVPVGELNDDHLQFELSCTSGTYVRSVAHDLGNSLGTGAHLKGLRRLKVGPFSVEKAMPIDELGTALSGPRNEYPTCWIPLDSIPLPFEDLTTDAQQKKRLAHGQTILVRGTKLAEGDWVRLIDQRRRLIAVGSVVERIGEAGVGVVQPRIVFS